MLFFVSFFLNILFLSNVIAVDYSNTDVVQLNEKNFLDNVIKSDGIWLVEFYAPWCGHCKQLAPEWKKAASVLKGVVNIAAVNADLDENKILAQKYGIQGFPTIKIFGNEKKNPKDYQKERSSNAIISTAKAEINKLINNRLNVKTSSKSKKKETGGKVVKLNENNFESLVLSSNKTWMVEFFAPWCGHCKKLAPEWKEASSALNGKVMFGEIDCTVQQSLASKYGIQGYPTIKVFKNGKPTDYQGGRNASDLISFAQSIIPPPSVDELIDSSMFEECKQSKLCAIAFLPNILDSSAKEMNNYIKILKDVSKSNVISDMKWLWTSENLQPHLQNELNVGDYGFPAFVVFSPSKKVYSTFVGSFETRKIKGFLNRVATGKESRTSFDLNRAKAIKATKWDGKDGEILVEEEL